MANSYYFGYAIDIDRKLMMIADPDADYTKTDSTTATDAGCVFVYERSSFTSNTYGLKEIITSATKDGTDDENLIQEGNHFGTAIKINGSDYQNGKNTALITAKGNKDESNNNNDAGCAYFFVRNGS
jgi:hypothetical protein